MSVSAKALDPLDPLPATTVAPMSARVPWLWIAGLAVACLLPLFLSEYRVFQATQLLIYATVLFGLTILTGFNGQISLGHGAFFALGAYTTAILMARFGFPFYATLPFSAVICLLVGFLFGRPALRLEGHYLALATFALAIATPQFLKHKQLQVWTGGAGGIQLEKPAVPFGLPMSQDVWLYLVTLAVALILLVIGRNLLKGRIGRAFLAVRDHPTAAACMGINLPKYKSAAFAISALYAGVGGSLSAIAIQFVSPDSFYPLLSVMFLVGAVIGGLHSLWGPLFGALFIQFVPTVADDISKSAPWAIYGVVMILGVSFMKRGIAGALPGLWQAARRKRG